MFHYFTKKFTSLFSLLFASNFSLRFTLVIFAFFRFFSLFFALNFSLHFDLVIFASKRNKGKRNSSLFFRFFSFFSLFLLFFAFFRLIFVSLRFFHLIFAYFTIVFASDFWCFASKWIMWNQAFFLLPSETKFSFQFQISLLMRKWGCTLHGTLHQENCGMISHLKLIERTLCSFRTVCIFYLLYVALLGWRAVLCCLACAVSAIFLVPPGPRILPMGFPWNCGFFTPCWRIIWSLRRSGRAGGGGSRGGIK